MTRFKKELLKRGVILEESVPFMPYEYLDTILVNSEKCYVYYYDMRVGAYKEFYDRSMKVSQIWCEDDDYNFNMPCDNTGNCAGLSCSNFINCKGGV